MNWLTKWSTALVLGSIMGAALCTAPVYSDDSWQALVPPNTGGGLVLGPRISGAGTPHPFMAWAGTGNDAKYKLPEFTFSVLRGDKWSDPKAPFFGNMINNVRCLALAMARFTVGAIYMRNTEQDKQAFEVLFTGSSDKGWSFSKPTVADSFIHEDSAGTTVAIAGVGGVKPMFMLGWLSEARAVKAGIWNPAQKADRPRAVTVGHYAHGFERLELCGTNNNGFLAAWYDGRQLRTASLAPLVGTVDCTETLASARVGLNFALTDNKGRNPLAVFEMPKLRKGEGARRQVWAWQGKEKKWERVLAAPPAKGERPFPSRLEACQDENGGLHVITVPKTGDQVLYSRLVDGKFTEPEVAMELRKVIGLTGVDISCVGDYVYVTASQGPYMLISRKKI